MLTLWLILDRSVYFQPLRFLRPSVLKLPTATAGYYFGRANEYLAAGRSLRVSAVRQIAGIHHRGPVDAGHGDRSERCRVQRAEWTNPPAIECAAAREPLFT